MITTCLLSDRNYNANVNPTLDLKLVRVTSVPRLDLPPFYIQVPGDWMTVVKPNCHIELSPE